MSIKSIYNKIISIDWYLFLYAGLLAMIIVDYSSLITPAFDGLPSEFKGLVRILLGVVGALRLATFKENLPNYAKVSLPLLTGIGLAVFLGTNHLFVLDIALVLMCSIKVKPLVITFSVWCVSFATLVGTMFLGKKGYIRNYYFDGFNALGFTKALYTTAVLLVVIVSFILSLVLLLRQRRSLKVKSFAALFLVGIISVGIVFLAILTLDRTRALPDGHYTIYSGDSVQGIEMHMHGVESYDLSFDTHAAENFEFRWEGQYYGIYADTDGVERSLCVIDGQLKLGDYEESKAAHCWVINSLPGTPYYWILNAETGYAICLSESGILRLEMPEIQGRIHERFLLRLGDENLDYYKSLKTNTNDGIDIFNAIWNFDVSTDYTGEAVTGDLSLVYQGNTLTEGLDYTVEYVDNFYPGQATVYVRGIGDYCGEIILNFDITIKNTMSRYANADKVQDFVFRAYRLGFNRLPTPEEFYELKEYICLTVQTPDSILIELLARGAFADSNAELVEGIYRLMLQRNGTRSEYDLWVNALDSGALSGVIIEEISNSPDYQNIWHNFNLNFH